MARWSIRYSPEHWVCFSCRKQFRKPSLWDGMPREFPFRPREPRAYVCPECGGVLVNMGAYFMPPRKADKRAWEKLRLLAEHGIRFHRESSKIWERMLAGPNPNVNEIKRRIACCPCHIQTPGQRLLRQMEEHQNDVCRK